MLKHRLSDRGFGLMELMVAIVLGLIVTAGITSMVVAILRANNENMEMTRLTQELRAVGELVTRDLRRSAFTPQAIKNIGRLNCDPSESTCPSGGIVNPFAEVRFFNNGTEVDFVASPEDGPADCVLFTYDSNANGSLEDEDRRGFRHDADAGAIDMLDGEDSACTSDSDWEALTDPETIEITALEFSTNDQQGFTTQAAGDLTVTVREIVITVSGRLVNDPSVSRTITETIRVRNDLMVDSS